MVLMEKLHTMFGKMESYKNYRFLSIFYLMKPDFFFKLFLSILFSFPIPLSTSPVYSQSSCQATVDSVIKEIKQKGVPKVLFSLSKFSGLTNPSSQDAILLTFTASNSKSQNRIADLLGSKLLMKSWAVRIFKQCGNTGYITFGQTATDWSTDFAMGKDGTLFITECANSPNELVNPDSEPFQSLLDDGYCAWVPVTF
jgi:hypothetical protein